MTPSQRRPAVLIGGFVQNGDAALAIQQGLSDVAEVTVSSQGVTRLSSSVLDSLVRALDRADCAIFVFPQELGSPAEPAYRDALFQLGIMVGCLGRERTFVVVPAGTAHQVIPTPLLGIGVAEYDTDRSDGNLRGAVGVATALIRDELVSLGPRMSSDLMHEFPASFEARLATAHNLYFWGMNQSDFLIRHFDTLHRQLAQGANLRALIVAPKGVAVRTTRLRFAGSVESDHETFRAKSSLARMCQLCTSFPDRVVLRTLDYPFSYGAFLFDGDTSDGVVYVKQYTFRITGGSKKPKFVYESGRTPWYEIVRMEGEQLWEAGSTWSCS